MNEFLDINIYFTGAIKDPEQIKGIMLQPDDQPGATHIHFFFCR